MKILQYNTCVRINLGTEQAPLWEERLYPVEMGWNEENEKIAMAEAHKGDYTVIDDGQEEPERVQTAEERIRELEEALALLLSGVTE